MLTLLADALMIATRQTPYERNSDRRYHSETRRRNERRSWTLIPGLRF